MGGMIRWVYFGSLSVFLITLAAHPAKAADTSQSSTRLQKVESQLSQQKAAANALDEKARQAAGDLETLRQKLIAAAAALQTKSAEQDELESHLADLEADMAAKTKSLTKNKQQLGALTSALIRLGQQPPALFFLHTGLTDEHIEQAVLLRALMPRIEEETELAARDLEALDDLRQKTAAQKRLVIAASDNLAEQQRNLDQLIRARQGLLQQTEAQKAAVARQLVALTSEAKDLHDLLDKVSQSEWPKSMQPPEPHGALRWPVRGNLVRAFGARDADGVVSQGLTFSALSGSPVVAPAPGRVVFAGPFRGYGQILILQHKDGYHSFLAGFGRIDAEMGEVVEAGEPLGVLPTKAGGRPELYFEWRHNGEPIDPGKKG